MAFARVSLKVIAGAITGNCPDRIIRFPAKAGISGGRVVALQSTEAPAFAGTRRFDQSGSTHLVFVTRGERYLVLVQPPSTTIDWPLIISLPGEQRKAMTAAVSAGSARRG